MCGALSPVRLCRRLGPFPQSGSFLLPYCRHSIGGWNGAQRSSVTSGRPRSTKAQRWCLSQVCPSWEAALPDRLQPHPELHSSCKTYSFPRSLLTKVQGHRSVLPDSRGSAQASWAPLNGPHFTQRRWVWKCRDVGARLWLPASEIGICGPLNCFSASGCWALSGLPPA